MTADRQAAEAIRSADEKVCLHGRFVVDQNAPLVEFATASTQAFAATDLLSPERLMVALVRAPNLPMRAVARERLAQASLPGLLPIADFGVIDWPLPERRREVIVYPRPRGGPLVARYGHSGRAVSEHVLTQRILPPLARALQGLETLAVAHRAIRPDNVFYVDSARTELVLGDCVSAPAGYNQPVLFEPIERALASPCGRGEGSAADDLYALGVALALLLVGANPVASLTDEQILLAKMERGSYSVLCEQQRIPLAMIDPLRGLLCDHVEHRWDLRELDRWLRGQRLNRSRPRPPLRPSSFFPFGGRQHWSLRTLARSLTGDVPAAAMAIRDGRLENWLRVCAKADDAADAVAREAASVCARKGASGSNDALVARVAMALDPDAPISYRGLRFMPDGLGPALAWTWLEKGEAQAVGDVLCLDLAQTWLTPKLKKTPHFATLRKDYARWRAIVDNRYLGYGIERCLYEMNPGFPCQSPLVRNAHVVALDALLPALEESAVSASPGGVPMDRHLAAFIAAGWQQGIQPHLAALADPGRAESVIVGAVGIFAALQRQYALPPLPKLAAWVGGMLNVVVATYHARATRAALESAVESLCREGWFPALYDLLADGDRRAADAQGFSAAVTEFAAIAAEIDALAASDPQADPVIREEGQRLAAALSVLGSSVVVFMIVISAFW